MLASSHGKDYLQQNLPRLALDPLHSQETSLELPEGPHTGPRVARVSVSAFSGMGEESAENFTDPEGEVGAEARSARESGVDELSVGSVWCSDLKELEEKATEE